MSDTSYEGRERSWVTGHEAFQFANDHDERRLDQILDFVPSHTSAKEPLEDFK